MITDFDSGCCPSKAVATIDTRIFPSKDGSIIDPFIISASESTSDLILFTISSTSKSFKSSPPVMFINKPRPASANCNGCGENDHSNQCNLEHDHEHKPAEKVLIEEHKDSSSEPENGVVFAVCIFAIAEDGTRVLVDHRASENLMDCLKNKREAERDYRDPEKRSKNYPGATVFTMTCDKVDAKVRIKEDGTWEILDILGRHEEAYREKKSWE